MLSVDCRVCNDIAARRDFLKRWFSECKVSHQKCLLIGTEIRVPSVDCQLVEINGSATFFLYFLHCQLKARYVPLSYVIVPLPFSFHVLASWLRMSNYQKLKNVLSISLSKSEEIRAPIFLMWKLAMTAFEI